MTSPYSLSRPGGVQGQVLGLARELRHARRRRACRRAVRRAAARARCRVRRAERRVDLERFGRADRGRTAPRRVAPRRRSARSNPISCTCTSRGAGAVPQHADRVQRPDGRDVPRVGRARCTSGAGPRCASSMSRLTTGASWSRRPARDDRAVELGRRVRRALERHRGRPLRERDADAVDRSRPCSSSAATSRARAWRCCSTRGARLDRDAVLWVGGDRAADGGAAQAQGRERRVARQHLRRRARAAHARRDRVLRAVAARRVVRRGAARGDGRGHADRRVRDRGVRERRPARPRRAARRRPAMSTRCGDALRRVLDDAGAARRDSSRPGRARAAEFSMARLAERYVELYEKAVVAAPRA